MHGSHKIQAFEPPCTIDKLVILLNKLPPDTVVSEATITIQINKPKRKKKINK